LSGRFGADGDMGFFRALIDERRITGPIITHTKNDRAVGTPIHRVAHCGSERRRTGRQDDPDVGMGRNGAQNTAEADNNLTMGLPAWRLIYAGKSTTPSGRHGIIATSSESKCFAEPRAPRAPSRERADEA
jgi:hypothetical protein